MNSNEADFIEVFKFTGQTREPCASCKTASPLRELFSNEYVRQRVDEHCCESCSPINYRTNLVIGPANRKRSPNFADAVVEEVASVEPLLSDARNETILRKSDYPTRDQDYKTTIEPKKKPVDFKVKTDQKYQKVFRDDDSKRGESSSDATATTPSMSSANSTEDVTSRTMETSGFTVPFLFHGEPMAPVTNASIIGEFGESPTTNDSSSTSENGTDSVQTTEETTAYRGRALNISAPEPANSLHSNITDLSDVSMDDDDKEIEGTDLVKSSSTFSIQVTAVACTVLGL